jgi:hypothetical protein
MDDLFDSAWLKWGWAVVEARALEKDIADFTQNLGPEGIGATRCDYQPKSHRFAVTIDRLIPFPPRWGLRLGSIVHNFRCSLDHIAWACVERGETPPNTLTEWQQSGVYFPISETGPSFNDALRGRRPKLPGVRRADIARIRRNQPYHGRGRADQHVFAILDRLSRLDKHRTLQPIAGYPAAGQLQVSNYRDCEIRRHTTADIRQMLEVGTEIAYVYVKKRGPNPEMHVEANLTVKPAIEKRFWFNEWWEQTARNINRVLREFAPQPDKLLETLVPDS